jgi:hypothetical protein
LVRQLAVTFALGVSSGCAAVSGFSRLERDECPTCDAEPDPRDGPDGTDDATSPDATDETGGQPDTAIEDVSVSPEVSPADTHPADAPATDAPTTDAREDGGTPGCTGIAGRGPVQIKGPSYCIDATEVTNAQYAAFLADLEGAERNQGPECVGNRSFQPFAWPYISGEEDFPVVEVDWCDAAAFCRWAGKRLCGKIGGGPVAYSSFGSATQSQWMAACSSAGTRTYPYGNGYDVTACTSGANKPSNGDLYRATMTAPKCVGGLPGLYDMSGNVWEWEDACEGGTALSNCRVRGGSGYETTSTSLACGAAKAYPRETQHAYVGFRCCSG